MFYPILVRVTFYSLIVLNFSAHSVGLAEDSTSKSESNTEILSLNRPYRLVEGEFQIVGNVHATDSETWPATFYFIFGENKDRCTVTFVGPKVFLTASHCLRDRELSGKAAIDDDQFKYNCYPSNTVDFAVCISLDDIEWAAYTRFETVNSSVDDKTYSGNLEGRRIVLVGFGCRSIGGCPLDHPSCWHGQLYYGLVRVRVENPYLLSQSQDVATCNGDSGGGSYLELGLNQRLLVGVNSTSDSIGDTTLVAIHSGYVQSFLDGIISANGVSICGKNLGGDDCVQY